MKKLTCFLFCLFTYVANAQDNNFNQAPLSLPSPQAAEFIRYGEIPVDYSTGVPNISLPLYKIISGKLELPISISYNASGIKVADVASTVGLGWSLSAGGVISRTVLGCDDQEAEYKPWKNSAEIDTAIAHIRNLSGTSFGNGVANFVDTVKGIFNRWYESQSDRYFYSFPGKSGVFRMNFQTGLPQTIPYSPLKVSLGTNNAGPYKIVDENGVSYYFAQHEWSGPSPGSYKNSYYLTKIQAPDTTDEINIYYKEDWVVSERVKSFQLVRNSENPSTSAISNSTFEQASVPQIPDSITARNVTVLFQYQTDRPDKRKSRLISITILNRFSREVIKVIELRHSYFGTAQDNNQRLRLDSVYIKGKDASVIEKYGYRYNTTTLPPYYIGLAWNADNHNVDYWGYYNGANSPNLIPYHLFTSQFTMDDKNLYGGNRNPDGDLMKACILTRIDFPTGGKTLFEFEPNMVSSGYSYSTNTNEAVYGGLRIKTISSYSDSLAVPLVKSYEYGGSFHTIIQPEMYVYTSQDIYWYNNNGVIFNASRSYSNICAEAFTALTTGANAPVIYSTVQEYYGTGTQNIGKIEYKYDNSSIPYYIYDPGILGNPRFHGQYLNDWGIYNPQLVSKTEFKRVDGQFIPVRKDSLTYTSLRTGNFITGVKIERQTPFAKGSGLQSYGDYDLACVPPAIDCNYWLSFLLNDHIYSNTTGVSDVPVISKKYELVYSPDASSRVIKATHYTYDTVTLLPVKEYSINSKGDTLNKFYKYSSDFAASAPYNTLQARNALTTLVETENYKGYNNFLSKVKTTYKVWGSNVIAPEIVEGKTLNYATETRLRYHAYDNKGNVISFSKENDLKISYLWDYYQSYPIAEVKNADSAAIAYTSFEAETSGNWSISSSDRVTTDSLTGHQCYQLSSGTITKSGLSSSQQYIVTYWTKNSNPFTISGTQTTQLIRIVSGWRCYQHLITGVTTVAISQVSGLIDELRLYPKDAQMTTFTFDPLIGMTSQCDAGNHITYYEYDAFGRLKIIRDQDQNILKTFDYKYHSQQ